MDMIYNIHPMSLREESSGTHETQIAHASGLFKSFEPLLHTLNLTLSHSLAFTSDLTQSRCLLVLHQDDP